jgi:hypothetical protein
VRFSTAKRQISSNYPLKGEKNIKEYFPHSIIFFTITSLKKKESKKNKLMSRVAQKVRQTTDTVTQQQSLTLVRNILRSSISSICYLRYLFPEDSFTDTQLAGLKIKSLVEGQNQEIKTLNTWMEQGVFDAIEKHYLKALIFCIFAEFNKTNTLLESYTFKFTYPSDDKVSLDFTVSKDGEKEKTLSFMTKEQIQQAWCTMIRTLITLSHTLPPLPHQRHIAMKLVYYDEITPEDYNPPGFVTADSSPEFEFIDESERVNVGGSVKTKYHTVSVRLDTAMSNYSANNPTAKLVAELDLDTVKSIVIAFEDGEITTKSIADALGIPRNDQRAVDALTKLQDMKLIIKQENRLCPNKTPENLDIYQEAKKRIDDDDVEI